MTDAPNQERSDPHVPPLAAVLTAILLPPILMMGRSVADAFLAAGTVPREVLDFVGDPIMSLLLALLYAMFALGVRTGRFMSDLQTVLGKSLEPMATVVLVVGAGGGSKQMLLAVKIGDLLGHAAAAATFHRCSSPGWRRPWCVSPRVRRR